MGKRIPSKNTSPTGWWVATIIERFEVEGEDRSNARRRCRAWSNVVLLKARDRHHAYRKAMRYGRDGEKAWPNFQGPGRCRPVFEGLASLIPVYDEFDEDGCEILFDEYKNVSVKRVQSWVREKAELEVFDDSDDA